MILITSLFNERNHTFVRIRGQKRPKALHRLIWETVHGEIPAGYEIHHLDGNGLNNSISNLVCISRSQHRQIHGASRPASSYVRLRLGQLRSKKVRCIETGEVFNSMAEVQRQLGFNSRAISGAIHKNHASYGYHWEFI